MNNPAATHWLQYEEFSGESFSKLDKIQQNFLFIYCIFFIFSLSSALKERKINIFFIFFTIETNTADIEGIFWSHL